MDSAKQLKNLKKPFSASVLVRPENIDEVFNQDFINHLIDQGFKAVLWASTRIEAGNYFNRLTKMREETASLPLLHQTNIVGDFVLFNKRFAHRSVYMNMNGDFRLYRDQIEQKQGNLKKNTLQEILDSVSEELAEKYS